MFNYDLYQMFPLPTPHNDKPNLYSYIQPTKPYILIANTRTIFSLLNNLDACIEYKTKQFVCKEVTISKRAESQQCEMQLFSLTTTSIPKNCQVKNMIAETEIWHPLPNNQWLFILSKPTSISILCHDKDETKEEIIKSLGILELDSGCKAYTDNAILESQTLLSTIKLINKIPVTDITEDDCCTKLRNNITDELKILPIKLTNLDLNELKYAQGKLQQFDEILQEHLNKPFIIKHTKIIISVLTLALGIGGLILLYNLFKWLGIIKIFKCLCCFVQEPRNPEQRLKTTCNPCVQIFNQCFKSNPTSNYVARYTPEENDIILENIPIEEPPQYSDFVNRRSIRTSSLNEQIPIEESPQYSNFASRRSIRTSSLNEQKSKPMLKFEK